MKLKKPAAIAIGTLAVLAFASTLYAFIRPGRLRKSGGGTKSSGSRKGLYKQTRFLMSTYVTIHAHGTEDTVERAIGLALDRMQEVDAKFNRLNAKSPVYGFNHAGTRIGDPEILGLIRTALGVSRTSGGAFDISVAPLIDLWGFSSEKPRLPPGNRVKDVLRRTGYQHLLLDAQGLSRGAGHQDMEIDLGGIAKGYAIAEAAKVLKAEGVESAVIDAGGDVFAMGSREDRLWKVGIRKARGEGLLGYLEVKDLAVMGSGDYERFFTADGKRYHHILDPHTGYPARGLAGITVVSPDPVLADAWATALFVMGPEKGLKMAEKLPDLEAIMVTDSGEVLSTSGLKGALKAVARKRK